MTCWFASAALLILSGVVMAQAKPDAHEQYRVTDRALQQNTAEVEQLLDMRMRHDLGLLGALDENIVRIERPLTTREMSLQRGELEKLDNDTQYLRTQYQKLATQARLLAEAAKAAAEPVDFGQSIPSPGSVLGSGSTAGNQPPINRAAGSQSQSTLRMPAAPAGETAKSRVSPEDLGALALDPLRAQIHGSKDHLRVAKALFKVGLALVDRGDELREQGRDAAAKDLDERAKIKLELAITELKPLIAAQDPDFVSLFYLGRCRELLFRFSERHEGLSLSANPSEFQRREQEVRDPFLQISARDVLKNGPAGAVETLGLWGQAAKTAMEHFRWMNVNAGFDQSPKIKSLTWPGEGKL
jgi:hypothetical protein